MADLTLMSRVMKTISEHYREGGKSPFVSEEGMNRLIKALDVIEDFVDQTGNWNPCGRWRVVEMTGGTCTIEHESGLRCEMAAPDLPEDAVVGAVVDLP